MFEPLVCIFEHVACVGICYPLDRFIIGQQGDSPQLGSVDRVLLRRVLRNKENNLLDVSVRQPVIDRFPETRDYCCVNPRFFFNLAQSGFLLCFIFLDMTFRKAEVI